MPALSRPSSRYAALLALLVAGACSSGTEPPVPTSVVVRTVAGATSATLVSIGATVALTARVLDQNGDTMSGQTVTWASGTGAVAGVSAVGVVTAVGNGSSQITATSGSASGALTVTVAQAAALVQKQAGDGQIGPVATALPTTLVAKVVDALGGAVSNAVVTWAVATGGGTVAGGNANAAGEASATWTPGNTAGGASVTATSGGVSATFNATLTAGPVAQITITAGNNQTAATSTAVPVDPAVHVADQFGNAKAGVTVTWTVTAGGGSVQASAGSAATSVTNSSGSATVVSWTLGAGAGTNTLNASAAAGVTTDFTATGATAGAPTTISVVVGDNQTALVNFATNVRPAVLVTDANAIPVGGAPVEFTPSGGGSVTGGTTTTNASGIAQVGSWTPGASAGAATLSAAVTGTGLTQMFNGTAANAAYNIEIRFIGATPSPTVQAAFAAAESFWESAIYGDQTDIPVNTTDACQLGVTIQETVDDIIILARIDSIDGAGQILGQAGPCTVRNSNALTVTGRMVFDSADIGGLGASLSAVIMHEMGHVLGFTSGIWTFSPLACAQNIASAGLDSYFHCIQANATNDARAIFDSIGGTSYTGGLKVPLENCVAGVPASCGAGTLFSHWREATFFNELMTGYLNSGANPLSVLTIAAFGDIGYQVNYGAAEAYSRTFTAPAAARGVAVDLSNDLYRGPLEALDHGGRVVRVVQP